MGGWLYGVCLLNFVEQLVDFLVEMFPAFVAVGVTAVASVIAACARLLLTNPLIILISSTIVWVFACVVVCVVLACLLGTRALAQYLQLLILALMALIGLKLVLVQVLLLFLLMLLLYYYLPAVFVICFVCIIVCMGIYLIGNLYKFQQKCLYIILHIDAHIFMPDGHQKLFNNFADFIHRLSNGSITCATVTVDVPATVWNINIFGVLHYFGVIFVLLVALFLCYVGVCQQLVGQFWLILYFVHSLFFTNCIGLPSILVSVPISIYLFQHIIIQAFHHVPFYNFVLSALTISIQGWTDFSRTKIHVSLQVSQLYYNFKQYQLILEYQSIYSFYVSDDGYKSHDHYIKKVLQQQDTNQKNIRNTPQKCIINKQQNFSSQLSISNNSKQQIIEQTLMGSSACCGENSQVSQPLSIGGSTNLQKNSVEQLTKAVDSLFRKYDTDQSGYLDKKQVTAIINSALSQMGDGRKAKKDQVNALVEKSDINKDGKITKEQLLKLFKKIAKC